MAKIRVLHVVNSLDPGGMENGVVNMIGALGDDFDFGVACLERIGRFAERLPKPGIVEVLGKTTGFSFEAVRKLAREISRLKPDLIHSHNLGPLIYASLATLGGVRVPILHGEHSQLTPDECTPRRLRQRRILYRCCREVHTVSHSQRSELMAKGFSKIRCVVNGVDVQRFIPGQKEERKSQLGIPGDALAMGIVGRFGPFKGHLALLEAFATLALRYPQLHLLIVGGGGPKEIEIREKVESLGGDRIHLTGFQENPLGFYQAMDFLIVPSLNEGLSNAVLEAMACAVPILANTACGNAEVIATGKEGIVADLGSAEKITAEVVGMIEKKMQFPKWGATAREKTIREYSLETMANGYANLYRLTAAQK